MFLIQIAITSAIVHLLASRQLDSIARKVAQVSLRVRLAGDRSAVAELPSKPLALFISTLVIGSYWTAVVFGIAGVWSL